MKTFSESAALSLILQVEMVFCLASPPRLAALHKFAQIPVFGPRAPKKSMP